MTTQLDLAKRALQAIGTRDTITALNDGSKEANEINLIYSSTLDQVLAMANWNFATKTAVLTLSKSAPGTPENPGSASSWTSAYPAPPWAYQYVYPTDCVRFRYTLGQGWYDGIPSVPIFPTSEFYSVQTATPPQRFKIGYDGTLSTPARCILTNVRNALGVYIARVTEISAWEPLFEQAFVAALAGLACMNLTGDRAKKSALLSEANFYISQARVADGNESSTIQDRLPDWIAVRYGVTSYDQFVEALPPLFTVD